MSVDRISSASANALQPSQYIARLIASVGTLSLVLTVLQIPLLRAIVGAIADTFLPAAFNHVARRLWPLSWFSLSALAMFTTIVWLGLGDRRLATGYLALRKLWRWVQWTVTLLVFGMTSPIILLSWLDNRAEGDARSTVATPEEGLNILIFSLSVVALLGLIGRSWQERHPDPASNLA